MYPILGMPIPRYPKILSAIGKLDESRIFLKLYVTYYKEMPEDSAKIWFLGDVSSLLGCGSPQHAQAIALRKSTQSPILGSSPNLESHSIPSVLMFFPILDCHLHSSATGIDQSDGSFTPITLLVPNFG